MRLSSAKKIYPGVLRRLSISSIKMVVVVFQLRKSKKFLELVRTLMIRYGTILLLRSAIINLLQLLTFCLNKISSHFPASPLQTSFFPLCAMPYAFSSTFLIPASPYLPPSTLCFLPFADCRVPKAVFFKPAPRNSQLDPFFYAMPFALCHTSHLATRNS